jgi:methylated-DNA-[protein]-cysteine S-methyltransferase
LNRRQNEWSQLIREKEGLLVITAANFCTGRKSTYLSRSGELYYVIINTSAGWIGLSGSDKGLARTTLPQKSREDALSALEINSDDVVESFEYYKRTIGEFIAYFNGYETDFQEKPDWSHATPFDRTVWDITRKIPYGETRSYSWVARQIGKSRASRAVGQALGRNPLPIIIPCHRVVTSDGKLGGFGGGLEMKRYLLALESKISDYPSKKLER